MYLDQNSSVSNCGEGAAMVNSGTDKGKHTHNKMVDAFNLFG
jgi:hypothetical protein